MGVFSTALEVASGMQLATELKQLKVKLDAQVSGDCNLAQEYYLFREKLGNDADDVAIADDRLASAIAESQAMVDALQPGPRAVFDKMIEGLGFKKV